MKMKAGDIFKERAESRSQELESVRRKTQGNVSNVLKELDPNLRVEGRKATLHARKGGKRKTRRSKRTRRSQKK